MPTPFLKMNGAGNDFVIFERPVTLTPEQVRLLANRGNPKTHGCDQVIVMEPSKTADIFMRIYNADGGQVDACGNATRCVAWLMGRERSTVETVAGTLPCELIGKDRVRVDMGEPRFDWRQIPLSQPRDTLHLDIALDGFSDPVGVSMGNPHAVFIVPDVSRVPVRELGPKLEQHPLFPERVNVSFAQQIAPDKIKLRVWERGAGETLACGTAACATLVALNRRGLIGEKADIELPGGTLAVEWDKRNNRVFMTGPVAKEFEGRVDL